MRRMLFLAATVLWPGVLIVSSVFCSPGLVVKEGAGHIVTLSPIKGERTLHRLARRADREDSWIRFGDRWVDIGSNEQTDSVQSNPAPFLSGEFRDARGGVVTWYHIHPRKVLPPGTYPPSINDLFCLAHYRELFREHLGAEIRAKVFDGHGVWEFEVTDEFVERLPFPSLEDRGRTPEREEVGAGYFGSAGFRLGEYYLLLKAFKQIEETTVDDPRLDRDGQIRRFVAAMAAMGVRVSYTDGRPRR